MFHRIARAIEGLLGPALANAAETLEKEKDRLRFVPEGGFPPADRLRFFRSWPTGWRGADSCLL
jgi:hypothetical protein